MGVPGEKPLEARERTNNKLNHIWRRREDSNPGHIGGRRVLSLSPLHPNGMKFTEHIIGAKCYRCHLPL